MKPPVVRMSDAFRGGKIYVEVRVVDDWRFKLGLNLIKLGCRVLRCSLKLLNPPSPEESSRGQATEATAQAQARSEVATTTEG